MAKIIKVEQEHIDSVIESFKECLISGRFQDGVVSFSKNFTPDEVKKEKAILTFSDIAWAKMKALVESNDKEVGWHGMADKCGRGDYYVDDIIVYPQTVTGATVETDQLEYDRWKFELDDDSFSRLRFHGHSHVNMGVSPSGTDTSNQRAWLDELSDDGFYIFIIVNKKGEIWSRIYDMEDNLLFEKSDVEIIKGETLEEWLSDSKNLVKEKKYTPVTVSTPSKGGKKEKKKTVPTYTTLYDDDEELMQRMAGGSWWTDPFYYK